MQTAIEANKFAKDEIIGISEHKITNEERIAQIQYGLADRGLKAHFSKANRTTKEGASAGVALLWKAWLDVAEVGEAFDEARAVSLVWRHHTTGPILIVQIYGISGKETDNFPFFERILGGAAARGIPFIVMGDFNCDINDVGWWNAQKNYHATVINFGLTCKVNDSLRAIDFMIVTESLQAVFTDRYSFDTSLATHKALRLKMRGDANCQVHVIDNPPQKPQAKPVFGPQQDPQGRAVWLGV
jgi:endonuclease/exonuclease/phosphatase family metal-dependent hydrolase